MEAKAVIIGLCISIIVTFALLTSESATKSSSWEKFSTLFKETKSNTSTYSVGAAGWNVRVIEWIPADNPNVRCVFVAGTVKAGTGCYQIASPKL